MAGQMRRGVGYCSNSECNDYAKGVFLLNHGDSFYCPDCRYPGLVVQEKGEFRGTSLLFWEVRVEHNYDPVRLCYRDVAIVRDNELTADHSSYTLYSPLIRTEKRALKVAESLLANLASYGREQFRDRVLPKTEETIMSFDLPMEEFKGQLKEWADIRSGAAREAHLFGGE